MRTARGTHEYTETGLSNVRLVNVELRACPGCGERELVTPRVETLHRAIARALSQQTAPLPPEAIRFLRKWLGLTLHRFARLMGVRHETVCRWERASGYPLTPSAERLLKLLVAQHDGGRYPVTRFVLEPPEPVETIVLAAPDWHGATTVGHGSDLCTEARPQRYSV
jgi:putative zinc finger/helix-turn-helix YgiT family protein